MTNADLFGQEQYIHPAEGNRRVRSPKPKGYAAAPGSGPAGKTCRDCVHYCVRTGGKFRKCALLQRVWTKGAGTDIRARSPACKMYEAEP